MPSTGSIHRIATVLRNPQARTGKTTTTGQCPQPQNILKLRFPRDNQILQAFDPWYRELAEPLSASLTNSMPRNNFPDVRTKNILKVFEISKRGLTSSPCLQLTYGTRFNMFVTEKKITLKIFIQNCPENKKWLKCPRHQAFAETSNLFLSSFQISVKAYI